MIRPRWAVHALVIALLGLATAAPAHADGRSVDWSAMPAPAPYRWQVADTEAALAEHSDLAGCIVRLESDALDPYSVGAAGELGVAQLHPRGLLGQFYAVGYTDPFSPYQSMDFLDWALERGEGPNWTTFWLCV